MARYIAANTIDALATSLGVSESAVRTFIGTHRSNGNIVKVLQYVEAAPGADEAEIETATGIDPTTLGYILKLLLFTRHIEAYT